MASHFTMLCKIDILYIISDTLFKISNIIYKIS